jgi:RimJ/RimL family protein N-acetyltransferase
VRRTAPPQTSKEAEVNKSGAKIRGEEIALRPTSVEDLPQLMALWNDGRVMNWVGFPDGLGYTESSIARWLERLQADPRRHHFVITSSSLGFCGEAYYAVDALRGRAGLDIKLRPEAQGGGRATAALRALVRTVFEAEPAVDAVWTEPAENNLAARTLYWCCGLRPLNRPADMKPGPSYWELARAQWARACGSETKSRAVS